MTESVTTIFTEMTALAEATGAVNLGQGFPEESGPSVIINAAVDALRAGHNQYAPLPGVPELREAIAAHQERRYGLRLDPATEIQVTFGATEAIAAALLAFVRPGDEVVALDPGYDSYEPITRRAGGTLRAIELVPPAWRLEDAALKAAITERTRMLLLNSPHNPTGRVLHRDELELIAAACIEHDLIAITDEVYEHLTYDGAEHIPLATLPGMRERTLTISSLGKTHSLTGWKVGWASGPAQLVNAMRGIKQFLSFAGGTPLQYAAAVGVAMPDSETAQLAAALQGKRDRLSNGLTRAGFNVLPTEGTYFVNADGAAFEADGSQLCRRIAHEAAMVAIPVSAFSSREDGGALRSIIRFAFCKSDETLDDAITRLSEWASRR